MTDKNLIEAAWDDRKLLTDSTTQKAIENVVELLDKGVIRVAEFNGEKWLVNDWIKKAVILQAIFSR